MKINDESLALVKSFEGCRLEAYRDHVGVVTIGYGHSERAQTPPDVVMGMTITQAEADNILRVDLEHYGAGVLNLMTYTPTPNQFGAMTSLAFNIGIGAFGKSTALRRFNSGDIAGAAEAMTWFNKAGGRVSNGLIRRRAAERALFLSESASESSPLPDAPRNHPAQSTTIQAAGIVSGIGGVGAAGGFVANLDPIAQIVLIAGSLIIIAAGLYIMRERLKKWADGIR